MQPLNVKLVYLASQRNFGSVEMRVSQLASIVNTYGSGITHVTPMRIRKFRSLSLEYLWARTTTPNCVFIFCKDAIDRVASNTCDTLRDRGVRIACDYIDKNLSNFDFSKVDAHIASSYMQSDYLKTRITDHSKIHLLLHQYDLRLWMKKTKKISNMAFYFGEPDQVEIINGFEDIVEVIPYERAIRGFEIEKMLEYKFQYCVRARCQMQNISIIKPATKVMNSIAIGMPPIVADDMREEITILGKDYPFIFERHQPYKDSNAIIGFLSDPHYYNKAQDRIRQIQAKFHPEAFAACFEEMCREIMSSNQ